MLIKALLAGALRGVSHPNTDLDAQTFLLRVNQFRAERGVRSHLKVSYQPQVTEAELNDPQVLIWDIGRSHAPDLGNFDHHQDHTLGATPMLLLQALGLEPSPLDRYVDLGDRGYFFKHPQPIPFVETLQGFSSGINLVHREDAVRSEHYQDLLEWVEQSGQDPFGRCTLDTLPERFRPFMEARRAEEEMARQAARGARWFDTAMGKVAYVASDFVGVMRALYEQDAALVVLHEPKGFMSGWRRPAPKYTIGANPAVVAVPEQLDLRPLFARLSALERSGTTWGGQAGIGGSPREDGGSSIPADQIIRETISYLGRHE